jgi:hypothetical protein
VLRRSNKRDETNIVAAAVHLAGGPRRVAPALGVSRSQIYRWLAAGTMSRAIYIHVSGLAKLSGIPAQFLGEEVLSDSDSPDSQYVERAIASNLNERSSKPTNLLVNPDTRSPVAHLARAGAKAALVNFVGDKNKNRFASITTANQPRGVRSKTESKYG